jgi:hypothetical protein
MLEQGQVASMERSASAFDTAAADAREPGAAGILIDAALIAELARTFDLDILVAEAPADPFRR